MSTRQRKCREANDKRASFGVWWRSPSGYEIFGAVKTETKIFWAIVIVFYTIISIEDYLDPPIPVAPDFSLYLYGDRPTEADIQNE